VLLADSVPVADVRVELHRVAEDAGALLDSALTDAGGAFSFELGAEAEAANVVFLVGARYGGLLYWGPAVHGADPAQFEDYSLAVFDTALVADPVTTLRTAMRHVVITPTRTGLQVEEIIDVESPAARTLLPASDTAMVWMTSLARDARGVVPTQGGVPAEDLAFRGGSLGFAGALPPTGIRVGVQYVVPTLEYSLRLDHATRRMEVLVMPRPGTSVEVSGLAAAEVSDDMQVPVSRFTGSDLDAVSGVSVRVVVQERGRGSAWVWLVVSLVLGGAAVASVRHARARP
jgi:hypothetical protein